MRRFRCCATKNPNSLKTLAAHSGVLTSVFTASVSFLAPGTLKRSVAPELGRIGFFRFRARLLRRRFGGSSSCGRLARLSFSYRRFCCSDYWSIRQHCFRDSLHRFQKARHVILRHDNWILLVLRNLRLSDDHELLFAVFEVFDFNQVGPRSDPKCFR